MESKSVELQPGGAKITKYSDLDWDAIDRREREQFEGYLEVNKGEIEGVTFNRREWDPFSDIINKEVITVKIFSSEDDLRGIWYNYSCHPVVLGPDNLLLSADWVYYTEEYLKKEEEKKIEINIEKNPCQKQEVDMGIELK